SSPPSVTLFPYTTLFRSVRVGNRADVTGEFDDRRLKTEADSEERQLVLARPADRLEHPFHAAHAEAPGHEQSVVRGEELAGGLRSEEHTSELQSRFDLVC